MDKYIIVNRDSNQIVCKGKNSSRHYRQSIGYVSKDCVVLQTTKGRAEKERDYLNQEYNKGWEIEKVEPIAFKDNREEIEKRMQEYEEEIEQAKQETREILQVLKDNIVNRIGSKYAVIDLTDIAQCAKELGIELED